MLSNEDENDYEFLIKDICNADLYYFNKSEFTIAQMETCFMRLNMLSCVDDIYKNN